jgi:regulation of enolase protein 1 (concanavalin A-like superfamily)
VAPPLSGSASYANGTWTVRGIVFDIMGPTDHFHFVSHPFTGDAIAVAKVTGITKTGEWAKAGLMFRNDSNAGSANVFVCVTAGGVVNWQWRSVANADTEKVHVYGVPVPTPATPVWLKLVRKGNDFSGFYSTNGPTWIQVGATQTVRLAATAQVGLAVTSADTRAVNTCTFTEVSVTSGGPVPAPR